uniref:Uncharacterized protein n=2 Tax=Aegilops tauschii subsp. strangulata TaxID=200361 RepID=A0A453JH50_AEGTS
MDAASYVCGCRSLVFFCIYTTSCSKVGTDSSLFVIYVCHQLKGWYSSW